MNSSGNVALIAGMSDNPFDVPIISKCPPLEGTFAICLGCSAVTSLLLFAKLLHAWAHGDAFHSAARDWQGKQHLILLVRPILGEG